MSQTLPDGSTDPKDEDLLIDGEPAIIELDEADILFFSYQNQPEKFWIWPHVSPEDRQRIAATREKLGLTPLLS